jgi:hypothetical protein
VFLSITPNSHITTIPLFLENGWVTTKNNKAMNKDDLTSAIFIITMLFFVLALIFVTIYELKKENINNKNMTKKELRQWIIEFAKAPAYPDVIKTIDSKIDSVIQQAIAEHEQSKWKRYPENKPEIGKEYLAQYADGDISKVSFPVKNAWRFLPVIAFRELPQPYQEGGEG